MVDRNDGSADREGSIEQFRSLNRRESRRVNAAPVISALPDSGRAASQNGSSLGQY